MAELFHVERRLKDLAEGKVVARLKQKIEQETIRLKKVKTEELGNANVGFGNEKSASKKDLKKINSNLASTRIGQAPPCEDEGSSPQKKERTQVTPKSSKS